VLRVQGGDRQGPGGKAGVSALAEIFGRDGRKVLAAAWAAGIPPRLRVLTQVEILLQVWVHHYYWDARGRLRWRDGHALPPASLRFDFPYDTDAHYCVKRDTAWSGCRTHFTETCTPELPEVVVHVATTIAPVQDGELTAQIHDARPQPPGQERGRLRQDHLSGLPRPPQCTEAVSGPRSLALLPTRELHEIQQHNRLDQHTEERTGNGVMRSAPASKPPSPRTSAPVACTEPATGA
jgi:hypothetical protein